MKRSAAPFRLDIVPLPRLQAAIAGAGALAMLAVALALSAHVPSGWPMLGLVPLAAVAAWRLGRPRDRCLRWDGQGWHLHQWPEQGAKSMGVSHAALDALAPVQLALVFDLGDWVLLRASRPNARLPIYLPLTRATQASSWGAMRAVLYGGRKKPD
ncbi:hypothetical protein [Roseateles sp.]|uniref:hypothetical protein n=1 Tax=Roseateles sp. TaxID=1971397 RepID=UPI00286BDC3A|nr:hypothetical protein [Roseateles sp.]